MKSSTVLSSSYTVKVKQVTSKDVCSSGVWKTSLHSFMKLNISKGKQLVESGYTAGEKPFPYIGELSLSVDRIDITGISQTIKVPSWHINKLLLFCLLLGFMLFSVFVCFCLGFTFSDVASLCCSGLPGTFSMGQTDWPWIWKNPPTSPCQVLECTTYSAYFSFVKSPYMSQASLELEILCFMLSEALRFLAFASMTKLCISVKEYRAR